MIAPQALPDPIAIVAPTSDVAEVAAQIEHAASVFDAKVARIEARIEARAKMRGRASARKTA